MGLKSVLAAVLLGVTLSGCSEDPAKTPDYAGIIGKVCSTKTALRVNTQGFREISLSVPGEGNAHSLAGIPALMRKVKRLCCCLLAAGSY